MIISPYFKITNLDFINKKYAQLEKNIIVLSQEQITDLVKEIFKLARHEFFQVATKKKEKCTTHTQEQYEKLSFIEKKFQQRIHNIQKKYKL
jgi:hypothetical protein